MYQLGATVMPEAVIDWQARGVEQPRLGDRDHDAALSGLFATAEPDRLVAVSVACLDQLRHLDSLVPGLAEVIDSRTGAGPEARSLRVPIPRSASLLAHWIAGRGAAEVCARLQSAGVAAGPVMDARDLLLDPHLGARGFYEWIDFGDPLGPPASHRPALRLAQLTDRGSPSPAAPPDSASTTSTC